MVGYHKVPGGDTLRSGNANTALTNHANKTFALMEGNLPFELGLGKSKFDVESVGFDDFNAQLKDSMSAHPRVDRETG